MSDTQAMRFDERVKIELPEYLLSIMKRYKESGEEVFLVGGSLRDMLMDTSPHDYDLATSALPEKTLWLFRDKRVIETGMAHGTLTVMWDGEPIEITTFRIDGSYADARHPDSVTFTKNIEYDLSRRDFTVNAMAYNPERGLVDPFGGKADIKAKIIRTVGDPQTRFDEDALRIMRAFRFSAQLGFEIDTDTLCGCGLSKLKLTRVAKERIASEFLKLIISKKPSRSLRMMMDTDVLKYICGDYVPNEQVIQTLAEMPSDDVSRLGYFLSQTDKENVRRILKDLKFSNKQITGACSVTEGAKISVRNVSEARRFVASHGIYAQSAIRASVLCENSPIDAISWVDNNTSPCKISDLDVSGKDLTAIEIMGKDVGLTLEYLLDAVIDDPSLNKKEKLIELAQKRKEI